MSAPDNNAHTSQASPGAAAAAAAAAVAAGINNGTSNTGISPPSPDQFASKRAAHYNEFKLIQAMRAKQQLMDDEEEEEEEEEG